MIRITYYVHGTTTDNENGIATGWLPGELSVLGAQQAKELAELVKEKRFDAVFCSDLKRAFDSAEIAFGNRCSVIQDKRLREINYGDFSGKPETFKDNLEDYVEQPFPGGESFRDVQRRISDFLEEITKKYDTKHIAILAHHAPQLALEVICNKKSWPEAIATDWRRIKSWQPGWEYKFK